MPGETYLENVLASILSELSKAAEKNVAQAAVSNAIAFVEVIPEEEMAIEHVPTITDDAVVFTRDIGSGAVGVKLSSGGEMTLFTVDWTAVRTLGDVVRRTARMAFDPARMLDFYRTGEFPEGDG